MDEAIASFDKALQLKPDEEIYINNRNEALKEKKIDEKINIEIK
ncbi:hypothetical protein CWATWH0402_5420 [Crocosphaera watsonii WH 0402]|uniref:Uncharacterized protein n=1 Tax=Crocosphaera watsonii WH 0402 TaxID=1284629 RepID=T2JMC6_CROWT|nr:hypothetical protein CWATWH0402_5420 [Crocosphaera watsonii WH 0402]